MVEQLEDLEPRPKILKELAEDLGLVHACVVQDMLITSYHRCALPSGCTPIGYLGAFGLVMPMTELAQGR